jgi:Mrp family chromosome partitioning ATPase
MEHAGQDTAEKEKAKLERRMREVGRRILVLSGKGGVGKSTVAANLAVALAERGKTVGLLDVDIHGPSIPKLLGLEHESLSSDGDQLLPIAVNEHLKVMSIGFLLRSCDDAVIWRGPLKYRLIQQFLADVDWGRLDSLVIDCPPGTGDEPLSVVQLAGGPAVAVVVTTPQELSISDVRRCVTFCRSLSLEVAGIVENMSGFVCPRCGAQIDLFRSGGGENLAAEAHVPFLGRIPIDPEVVISGDAGLPFVRSLQRGAAADAFARVVNRLLQAD